MNVHVRGEKSSGTIGEEAPFRAEVPEGLHERSLTYARAANQVHTAVPANGASKIGGKKRPRATVESEGSYEETAVMS